LSGALARPLGNGADIDPLTGLSNRRRFRVALQREVERWRRYGVPCALLLLDIDYMKVVNDNYGHTAGDLIIRHVADTLISASRDNDLASRLGGEEFALLLAGVADQKGRVAAERLQAMMSETPCRRRWSCNREHRRSRLSRARGFRAISFRRH
jgi:diguanylate cyclase (GGDEF)-like protein